VASSQLRQLCWLHTCCILPPAMMQPVMPTCAYDEVADAVWQEASHSSCAGCIPPPAMLRSMLPANPFDKV
jgi:hypothetical protein